MRLEKKQKIKADPVAEAVAKKEAGDLYIKEIKLQFTRQPALPTKPPSEMPNMLKGLLKKCDDIGWATVFMGASTAVMVLWMMIGLVLMTDCDARGLLAGAKTISDVRMSFTFRCVAEVDGKWVEVK